MSSLQDRISKLLLYGGAPFYCWPHKPLLHALMGSDYRRSYLHFRRDHTLPGNLIAHLGMLVFQLAGNFGLLAKLDQSIFLGNKTGPVSVLTAGLWSAYLLLRTSAPPHVRILSVAAIFTAYYFRHHFHDDRNENVFRKLTLLLEVLAFHVYVVNRGKNIGINVSKLLIILAVRTVLGHAVANVAPSVSPNACRKVLITLAIFMAVKSQSVYSNISPFLVFGLFGPLLSKLVGNRILYLFSCGWLASLGQGVTHNLTGEQATLPQLADIRDELGHTVFFPTLLLHSVTQSLSGNWSKLPA